MITSTALSEIARPRKGVSRPLPIAPPPHDPWHAAGAGAADRSRRSRTSSAMVWGDRGPSCPRVGRVRSSSSRPAQQCTGRDVTTCRTARSARGSIHGRSTSGPLSLPGALSWPRRPLPEWSSSGSECRGEHPLGSRGLEDETLATPRSGGFQRSLDPRGAFRLAEGDRPRLAIRVAARGHDEARGRGRTNIELAQDARDQCGSDPRETWCRLLEAWPGRDPDRHPGCGSRHREAGSSA